MFLNKKIAIVVLALAALAPLAAQADSGGLFGTPQRIVYGHVANDMNIAPAYQSNIVNQNPCLSQASGKLVSDIENGSTYDKALSDYNSKCSNTSASAPVFTIYGDYEPVPGQNNPNYRLAAAILVKNGNSRARLIWTTDPNHSQTANNDYVARVATAASACPNIAQWEQRANINAAQTAIVSEINNEARTCSAGNSVDGVGDGLGTQARSRRGSSSSASDPNAVQGASWASGGAGSLQ